MAAAADFMGVAVTSLAILVVVAMDGAAAAMGGVAVTGKVGTVVVGMDGAGTVVVGMAVLPTGGGVTHTRTDTGLMVGESLLGERTGSGDSPPRSRCACGPTIDPKRLLVS